MNKIAFPRTSYDGSLVSQEELESWYSREVETEILERLNSIRTEDFSFLEKRTLTWIKCCLHNILLALPEKLDRISTIVNRYGKGLFRDKSANNQWNKTNFGIEIYKAFNYDGYRKNTLIQLAEKLNIKSCPYCNMHYTLFAEDGDSCKDKLVKLQFDHFFDKAEYPFLSMSLYNLIPSCGICNQGKSTGRISLKFHPYASCIADQFHFEVVNPLALFSGAKKDRIELELMPDDAEPEDLKRYNDMFHIQTLYRRHGDIAQEVFDKAYEEPYYLDSLSFKFLNSMLTGYSLRLIYGTYMDDREIEKRPMSKFIQDLRNQAVACKLRGEKLDKTL